MLSLAINGRSAAALDAVYTHADTWPRDIVVLALAMGAFGFHLIFSVPSLLVIGLDRTPC